MQKHEPDLNALAITEAGRIITKFEFCYYDYSSEISTGPGVFFPQDASSSTRAPLATTGKKTTTVPNKATSGISLIKRNKQLCCLIFLIFPAEILSWSSWYFSDDESATSNAIIDTWLISLTQNILTCSRTATYFQRCGFFSICGQILVEVTVTIWMMMTRLMVVMAATISTGLSENFTAFGNHLFSFSWIDLIMTSSLGITFAVSSALMEMPY